MTQPLTVSCCCYKLLGTNRSRFVHLSFMQSIFSPSYLPSLCLVYTLFNCGQSINHSTVVINDAYVVLFNLTLLMVIHGIERRLTLPTITQGLVPALILILYLFLRVKQVKRQSSSHRRNCFVCFVIPTSNRGFNRTRNSFTQNALKMNDSKMLDPSTWDWIKLTLIVSGRSSISVWLIQLLCLCRIRNRLTCLVRSKLVKQEVSHTVILPLTKCLGT